MEILFIFLFFIGIFFMQIIISALYASLDKFIDKNPKTFFEIWINILEDMIGLSDNVSNRAINKEKINI